MFLENMTWQQIRSRVEANDDFVKRNFNRIHGEWLKTAKRTRPLPVCFHKSVKSHDKDEFLFVGCSHDGKTLGIVILAVIPSEKGKEYVMIDEDMYSDFLRDKLTPHFIKRYRERGMNGQECSVEKTIATFFMKNERRTLVYEDPEDKSQVVFTTKQGLAICKREEDKGFEVLKTYIDDSMLFATQRLAKEKVMAKLPDDLDMSNTYYINMVLNELIPVVQEIYAKHKSGAADYLVFKKNNVEEEVNLNFKLKADKQILERNQLNKPKKEEKRSPMILPSFLHHDSSMMVSLFKADLKNYNTEIKGNPDGKGKLYFKEKGKIVIEYKGDLKDGKPQGTGILKMQSGDSYEGTFEDGSPSGHIRHTLPDGSYEEGIFHNFKRDGMIHTHTPRMDMWAMYSNDQRIGNIRVQTEHFTYDGEFKNDGMNGKGKLMYTDGRGYEGTFKNGQLKGKGKEYIEDGSVIEANFKKGLADGLGTLTEPDGTIYTGNFDGGDLDGFVQKTKPDGTSEIVEFCYGDNMDDWDDEEWEEEEEFNDEAFEEFLNKFKGDNEDD